MSSSTITLPDTFCIFVIVLESTFVVSVALSFSPFASSFDVSNTGLNSGLPFSILNETGTFNHTGVGLPASFVGAIRFILCRIRKRGVYNGK